MSTAAAVEARKSMFLEGNYAPVVDEVTAERLPVIGSLPRELNGLFVRNGPNPQFPPRGRYHWFDGDGMLHGVHFHEGRADYRNRYVRTRGYTAEAKAGRALWGGLLDPPNILRFLQRQGLFKNAANTALVHHAGRLLALWEAGEPYEVNVPDLATVGPHTFGGKLRHNFTAHPKVDPSTGEMFCFGYQPVRPYVRFSVVDKHGTLVRTLPIDVPRPVMMHDFALTERHALFLDLPQAFDFRAVFRGGPLLRFRPELGARVGILPRDAVKGVQPRWFEIPPCFVFHTLNAHEEGDTVVLYACRFDQPPSELGGRDGERSRPAVLARWRFDLRTGAVAVVDLDDVGCEFPRLNESRLGRPARFGYAGRLEEDLFRGVLKYDLVQGTSERHSFGPGRCGGEAVFVPRPGGRSEDDGWLLNYIYDQATGKSEALVLDAQDIEGEPTARVLLPTRVPYGFHGTWIDAGRLSSSEP